jgi:transcriptional regulator with XRE-family HTH domain
MGAKTIRYEDIKEQLLADPEVRQAYEDMEPAHQLARLRIMRGLTQTELAARLGTKQPSIARLESGKTEPTLSLLRRAAEALDCHMVITFKPRDK